jgi:hypothetical protein
MLSANLKSVLDSKLWRSAEEIITHYVDLGYRVSELTSIDETYTYTPHLVCKKSYETIAIDIRERCNVESYFERFVTGCQANRIPVKICFAVPEYIEGNETIFSHAQRSQLINLGIGLMVVSASRIRNDIGTISCDRRFVLPPGSSLGKYKNDIDGIIAKYNSGKCLDAIRDLCEKAEDATVRLALKAAKKKIINATTSEINNSDFDWAGLIDGLSVRVWKGNPQTQIITDKKLRSSLHDFRDKRNLSDHRKTPQQLRDLEQQYPEAILQGIRLLRKLINIYNKLK